MSSSLAQLAISSTGFVFDQRTGATFTVNPTGLLLLESLRDGVDRSAIVQRLQDRFDVGHADLERDVQEFVRTLTEEGLLPRDTEGV